MEVNYQSTVMGDEIVALGIGPAPVADVMPIAHAEAILRAHRFAAKEYAERSPGYATACLKRADAMADALDVAAKQRAKFGAHLETLSSSEGEKKKEAA